MARFNNNMFQFEDFDMTGIMNPELVDVMEMRKEANLARGNATDQYEADVADFKNIQATEAEQGIASLPNAPQMPVLTPGMTVDRTQPQQSIFAPQIPESPETPAVVSNFIPSLQDLPTVPNIDYTNFNPTLFDIPFTPPDLNFEDIDYTNIPDIPVIPNIPTFVDNPYTEVFDTPTPDPDPVVTLPDLGLYDYNNNVFDPTPAPYTDPYEQGDNYVTDDAIYNPTDDIIDVDIPVSDSSLPDYPFVDPETGGDIVLVVGDPTNPGPGVVVRDPETGELPPGFTDEGPVYPPGTTPPEIYTPPPPPPPPPPKNPYTGRDVVNPYTPYELPMSNPSAGYTPPMDPSLFGSTPGFEDDPIPKPPGMKFGGRVPMGNNNMLNSGLSRLPLNQQNDTLTQVFQSGFRPRR